MGVVSRVPAGLQRCGWRCGYICAFWQLYAILQCGEMMRDPAKIAPPAPPSGWIELVFDILSVRQAQYWHRIRENAASIGLRNLFMLQLIKNEFHLQELRTVTAKYAAGLQVHALCCIVPVIALNRIWCFFGRKPRPATIKKWCITVWSCG